MFLRILSIAAALGAISLLDSCASKKPDTCSECDAHAGAAATKKPKMSPMAQKAFDNSPQGRALKAAEEAKKKAEAEKAAAQQ